MTFRKLTATLVATFLFASGASAGDPIVLKMAHQWPQDETDYVIATAIKFSKEVERRTNGEIKINIFPTESLVKALATHTALKNGSVDLAIYPYVYAAGAIPEMNLTLVPGLWKTHDEVFRFRDSEPWKKLEQKAQDFGFKTLSWIQLSGGVASKKKPIALPQDLSGMKVRVAGKTMEYAVQKMGASTVSIASSELYNAMQLGLLDAVWTSSHTFVSYRLSEVASFYVSPEDYSYFYTIEPIAISMKTWNKLSPEHQKILVQVGASLEQETLAGAKADDSHAAKVLAQRGVKVQKLTLDGWNQWQKLFREQAFEKFRKDVPGGDKLLNDTINFYK